MKWFEKILMMLKYISHKNVLEHQTRLHALQRNMTTKAKGVHYQWK